MEKIIFNLLSNAFKYTPSGGYIRAEIRGNVADGTLHFRIRNSGKGLTEKQMSEIFSRFKIFESSNLKHAGSTGVGLNLTKSLTELLGGEITVGSVLGEYVEFNVSLPSMHVNSGKESQPAEEEAEAGEMLFVPKQKEISILIVEDEKNIRELLKDILLPYYQVREAADGEEALKEIEQKQPDIIISDVLMPRLDGITLTDILKANERTAHIPIIHISAKNSIEDQINAYKHGTDLYIPKPFHPRHVLSAVENMINKYSLMKEYFKSSRSSLIVRDGITMHKEDELLLGQDYQIHRR
ncbi:response regulator [Bacteroides xylanisolvens]|nr:response regulator [Bacteroides xylanisolvens]